MLLARCPGRSRTQKSSGPSSPEAGLIDQPTRTCCDESPLGLLASSTNREVSHNGSAGFKLTRKGPETTCWHRSSFCLRAAAAGGWRADRSGGPVSSIELIPVNDSYSLLDRLAKSL